MEKVEDKALPGPLRIPTKPQIFSVGATYDLSKDEFDVLQKNSSSELASNIRSNSLFFVSLCWLLFERVKVSTESSAREIAIQCVSAFFDDVFAIIIFASIVGTGYCLFHDIREYIKSRNNKPKDLLLKEIAAFYGNNPAKKLTDSR